MIAWVASHTGLPCIYSPTPARVTSGWRVLADGTGPVWVADALATPGQVTTYQVGAETVRLTRRDDGHCLTDTDGRRTVPLAWLGDDSDATDPRVSLMSPSGRRAPVARWALQPSTPTGSLEAVTEGYAGTMAMRQLVAGTTRTALVAIHSRARCQVPSCDIPTVRLVYATGVSSARSGRTDVAEREWQIDYRSTYAADITESGAAPVVTWGEWAATGRGWQAMTALQVARTVAGMPE